jgi:hypothetical protein
VRTGEEARFLAERMATFIGVRVERRRSHMYGMDATIW